MVKKYRVALAEEEQQELKGLVSRGRAAAYRQTHARILLLCDENQANGPMKDEEVARALQKEQLNRRPKKLDGHDEAQLIALACSQPPEGRASWTLQLLADRLVECEIVDRISAETVRQTLQKRTQALAERALVHPATGQRRVRLRHGGRAGGLPPSIRGQRGNCSRLSG